MGTHGGSECERPPEGQARPGGEPGRAIAPRGKERPPPSLGGTERSDGANPAPRPLGHPAQRGCGPRSAPRPPQPPLTVRAPPSRARTGAGPPGPAIPPSPPHSPRGAATSPCRAGVGAAPAREGGRGREGAVAAPSVPLHVPGAGQPRKRGRGGGGGHGATSDPAAEVAGARARGGSAPGRRGRNHCFRRGGDACGSTEALQNHTG